MTDPNDSVAPGVAGGGGADAFAQLAAASAPITVSRATVPPFINGPDAPSELGVKFRSDVAGDITGVRF